MLLSPIALSNSAVAPTTTNSSHRPSAAAAAAAAAAASLKPLLATANANNSASLQSSTSPTTTNNNTLHHHVTRILPSEEPEERNGAAGGGGGGGGGGEEEMVASASAVSSAIRRCSTSPVEFVQTTQTDSKKSSKLVLPSSDFQRLCVQQLDLFRRIVDPDAVLSVYVRPAGSYLMDRLELRRVTSYPGGGRNAGDIVILVGNFNIPTGLRAAEAALSTQQAEFVPEHGAVVFPMVKHPFVVGFLVAELPVLQFGNFGETAGSDIVTLPSPEEAYGMPPRSDKRAWRIQNLNDTFNFTAELRLNAINIAHSLAIAYVMDQKAMLLQQSSWQNNVRMSTLVEQIRGPLSSIRSLSKMLSTHVKRSEISHDIVEDILVQGDRMRDTLEELQEAVYLTKANIVRYNEETLKKIHNSAFPHPDSVRSQFPDDFSRDIVGKKLETFGKPIPLDTAAKDLEMPMPPMALAPLQQHGMRPSNVSEVLSDLVEAVKPLAHKQRLMVEFNKLSESCQVAVEEPALRQALSNLIEGALLRTHVGGKVEIVSADAPAGGALVVVDDDGPDMHYMTQMHSLTPFGAELLSENMVEDNMTWNFIAGLTVARQIFESYGCVVRVISPRTADAALGAGGTRIEVWLPSFSTLSGVGVGNEA